MFLKISTTAKQNAVLLKGDMQEVFLALYNWVRHINEMINIIFLEIKGT